MPSSTIPCTHVLVVTLLLAYHYWMWTSFLDPERWTNPTRATDSRSTVVQILHTNPTILRLDSPLPASVTNPVIRTGIIIRIATWLTTILFSFIAGVVELSEGYNPLYCPRYRTSFPMMTIPGSLACSGLVLLTMDMLHRLTYQLSLTAPIEYQDVPLLLITLHLLMMVGSMLIAHLLVLPEFYRNVHDNAERSGRQQLERITDLNTPAAWSYTWPSLLLDIGRLNPE